MQNWNIQVLTYFTLGFPACGNEEQASTAALIRPGVASMEICSVLKGMPATWGSLGG